MDVREYLTADGRNPYREWLDTLDVTPRARIQARVLRFSTGNFGDHKSVGGGVNERAIDVQVTRLRRKIEPDPGFQRYLRTVRGQGYRLVDA